MKIERISDNKFSCAISGEELQKLNLTLSDLSYGSSSVKRLFVDIMKQAREEINFEPEELPLMIEAIPTRDEGLLLQFSYVSEADEVDSRFAHFAPFLHNEGSANAGNDITEDPFSNADRADDILNCLQTKTEETKAVSPDPSVTNESKEELSLVTEPEKADHDQPHIETNMSVFVNGKDVTDMPDSKDLIRNLFGSIFQGSNGEHTNGAPSIMDFFQKFQEVSGTEPAASNNGSKPSDTNPAASKGSDNNLCILFRFSDFDHLVAACRLIAPFSGTSRLYKQAKTGDYLLAIYSLGIAPNQFNSICNNLSEYGSMVREHTLLHTLSMDEHGECMIEADAIGKLSEF